MRVANEKKTENSFTINLQRVFLLFRKVSCVNAFDALWMRNQILTIFCSNCLVWESFHFAAQSIGYVQLMRIGNSEMVLKAWNCCSFHFGMISMNWQLFYLNPPLISQLWIDWLRNSKMTCIFKITKWFNEIQMNSYKIHYIHLFRFSSSSSSSSCSFFCCFSNRNKNICKNKSSSLKLRSMLHKCYTHTHTHKSCKFRKLY